MALKKPVITSNFGGLKEVNINKKTGLVINVKNTKLFANKIANLMKNKNKRILYGKNGFKNYNNNFTSSIMANNYYRFIEKNFSI